MIDRCYRCPLCKENFWVQVAHRNVVPPTDCPLCHNTGEAPKREAKLYTGGAPALLRGRAKSVDTMYRQMEEGSAHRADMAKAEFGLDDESASAIKMTNMRDDAKPGETSEIPLTVAQTNMMQQAQVINQPGAMSSAGLSYGQLHAGTRQGPHPYAGSKAQSTIREFHSKSGAPMADNPSLEWKASKGLLS